ncbi:MAG: S-layer homology domain-containing protein [Cyanobacteria bacterium J06621_8]
MTNSSPPEEPQNPMRERRKRPATGVTFDEMIAIIVAFATIGTILFWSIGRKNNRFANNLTGNANLLSSEQAADTGLSFGNILSGNTNATASLEGDIAADNRRRTDELSSQEAGSPFANQGSGAKSQAKERSFGFASGAKFAPVAGVATSSALGRKFTNNQSNVGRGSTTKAPDRTGKASDSIEAEPGATTETPPDSAQLDPNQPQDPDTTVPEAESPAAEAPEQTETAIEPEVAPTPPDTAELPEDVAPDYWAFPFVRAMRDQELVPELAKNQEFDPDALITRATMATLVSQAFSQQPATAGVKKFKDVTDKNALARDIDQAVSTGFMRGYSDDEFKPLENIPRYQVLVTLATGLGLQPSGDVDSILQQFSDSTQIPDWAKQQVAAATEVGLVVNPPNTPENSLIPEQPATKAEVAAMIHQALVSTGQLEPLDSELIIKP